MFNLEQAIAEWRRRMLVAGLKTPAALEELENHLRDEIEQQTKSGLSEAEAFKTAVQKIGPAQVVQSEFKKVEDNRLSRDGKRFRILVAALAALIVLNVGCTLLLRISPVAKITLKAALVLELQALLLTLVRSGLVDHRKMVRMRRYVIVGNLVLGGLLTTPEVVTQLIMAVVLQVLYEINVWITWYWERQNKAQSI